MFLSPTKFRSLFHAFGLVLILTCTDGLAQTIKTSSSSGNWDDISWSPAGLPTPTDNVIIAHTVTIPEGATVEINDVEIAKDGYLIVDGTLKIHGNLTMSHNNSQFKMGPAAFVIIDGNFHASNQVSLEISSYLIIQGDFTKDGGSQQGDLNVEDANIYIFGDVDDNWTGFETCGSYGGDTGAIENEDCDYGTEDDYESNHDTFPPEMIDLINCYDLSGIRDQEICEGLTATFSVENEEDVNYQWQVKTSEEKWEYMEGEFEHTLILSNVDFSMSGNHYRVIASPESDIGECKLSISRVVTLNVINFGLWTGTTSTDWNTASNWSCNLTPTLRTNVIVPSGLSNYPELSSGTTGKAKNIDIAAGASVQVLDSELQIAGTINNSGSFTADEGTISMVGDSPQSIPAETFAGNRIKNLISNNSTEVSLEGDLSITGILRVTKGTFFSGGFLTLISDEAQTALIDGSGNGEISGTLTMQRYLDNSFGYKYFASPFENSTLAHFDIALRDPITNFPNFYRYNENREDSSGNDATGWQADITASSALKALEGYALNFGSSSDSQTVELSGTVNNGPQERILENHNRKYTQGFNLIGNPYPSPIDWDATTGWTKTNIDNAIYFFTAGTEDRYTGTYTSYVNGVQSDDKKSSNIIPSMQGFFVHVSDADSYPVSGTLGMTNAVRINDFSQSFLKQSVKQAPELIRITAGFKGEKSADPAVIYFAPYSTHHFEKDLDAHKMMNTAVNVPNIYSITPDSDRLAISAVPHPDYGKVKRISLGLKTEKSGTIAIRLKDVENFSSGSYIYLIDQEKKIAQNLNSKPEYLFSMKKGQNDSRFHLLFSETKITNKAVVFDEPFEVETGNGRVVAKMNLKQNEKGSLLISTVSGRQLEVLSVAEKEIVEIHGIKSTGVYLFTYRSGNENETFSRKVLVKK